MGNKEFELIKYKVKETLWKFSLNTPQADPKKLPNGYEMSYDFQGSDHQKVYKFSGPDMEIFLYPENISCPDNKVKWMLAAVLLEII